MTKITPYGRHTIDEEDIAAVVEVLKCDFLTQGPAVTNFENELSKFTGCKHAIVVNSGTAALHLAYSAIGAKKGDAVIVPAITFSATANAALYCGATPVFADVDPKSGLMTAETLERAIARAQKLGYAQKIVVPVHFAGLPVEMKEIVDLASAHSCSVFEDACHAIGAQYREHETDSWKKTGNWHSGSMGAAFSFHPVKHVATGEGGAILTNNDAFASKLRTTRTHGIVRDPEHFRGSLFTEKTARRESPWYHEMSTLGWNYRMPDILAALGASQMKKLPSSLIKRRQIAEWYREGLANVDDIELPVGDSSNTRHSWHLFPIKLKNLDIDRTNLMIRLREKGVGTQVHYIPVPAMPFYEKDLKIDYWRELKGSVEFYRGELSLPMFPGLNRDHVHEICQIIKETINY